MTKIRVSVNQVKIYKFFQDFARILVEKTRTTRIAFKKIFVKLDLVFPVHFLGQFVPFGNKQSYIEWACFTPLVFARIEHIKARPTWRPVRRVCPVTRERRQLEALPQRRRQVMISIVGVPLPARVVLAWTMVLVFERRTGSWSGPSQGTALLPYGHAYCPCTML